VTDTGTLEGPAGPLEVIDVGKDGDKRVRLEVLDA
jgi:hypothetical protein